MSEDLIRRSDAIKAINGVGWLEDAEYEERILAIPTIEPKTKVVAQVTFDEEKLREIVKEAVERFKEEYEIELKRGEWKPFDLTWGRSIWYCTACEESTEVPCDIWEHKPIYKYCPNCGAEMREREGE